MKNGSASTVPKKARTVSKNTVGFCFYVSELCLVTHPATEEAGKRKSAFPLFTAEARKGEGSFTLPVDSIWPRFTR